jgi:hypothetical protein
LHDIDELQQAEATNDQECEANNQVNLAKAKKLARIVADVQYHQSIAYALHVVPSIVVLLDPSRFLQSFDPSTRRNLAKLNSQIETHAQSEHDELDFSDVDSIEFDASGNIISCAPSSTNESNSPTASPTGSTTSSPSTSPTASPRTPAPSPTAAVQPTAAAPMPPMGSASEPPETRLSIFTMFQQP